MTNGGDKFLLRALDLKVERARSNLVEEDAKLSRHLTAFKDLHAQRDECFALLEDRRSVSVSVLQVRDLKLRQLSKKMEQLQTAISEQELNRNEALEALRTSIRRYEAVKLMCALSRPNPPDREREASAMLEFSMLLRARQ